MARIRMSRAPRRATKTARESRLDLVVTIIGIGFMCLMVYMMWPMILDRVGVRPLAPLPTATVSNVGGQAPASVRGTNPDPIAPAIVATPIPGIAQSEQEAITMYQTAVAASEAAPSSLQPPASSLPLNSAGDPVIDTVQQQQLDQSAQMAADEQQAAILAQQLADADSRAPDVSKEDAEKLMHRDLCSVPRANPHTCDRGLFKPTPVQP